MLQIKNKRKTQKREKVKIFDNGKIVSILTEGHSDSALIKNKNFLERRIWKIMTPHEKFKVIYSF